MKGREKTKKKSSQNLYTRSDAPYQIKFEVFVLIAFNTNEC